MANDSDERIKITTTASMDSITILEVAHFDIGDGYHDHRKFKEVEMPIFNGVDPKSC
uniref:Uncharacterized protein n=1 Tax=Cucumis melo TaxID=3656 RepID=A0A9I9CFV4_CUCME